MKLFTILSLALLMLNCGPKPKPAETKLQIVNATDSAVTVWVTLGATPGCLQDVTQIPYVTSGSGLVGSFVLQAGDSTVAYAPSKMGFNGNLSFNTQPMNCPTESCPNGVNIFEFIINNSFQVGTPQETVDISCVAGVNCAIECQLSGGPAWNAGVLNNITSIHNSTIDGNKGLPGVYPYGCDTCTGAKNPPSCTTNSNDKQRSAICNIQRNALPSNTGLVKVIYKGGL
jgi:hypothetical protein